jgi:hypothetical protein
MFFTIAETTAMNALTLNTTWGWAVVAGHELRGPVSSDIGGAHDLSTGVPRGKPRPVIVITPLVGPRLVFEITERELVNLGVCPVL